MSQEIDAIGKCYTNTDNVSEFENEDKAMVTDNVSNAIKCFLPSPSSDNDKRVSAATAKGVYRML